MEGSDDCPQQYLMKAKDDQHFHLQDIYFLTARNFFLLKRLTDNGELVWVSVTFIILDLKMLLKLLENV